MAKASKDNSSKSKTNKFGGSSIYSSIYRKKKFYFVGLIIFSIILISIIFYIRLRDDSSSTGEQPDEVSFAELINSGNEEDKTKLVDIYGEDYQAAVERNLNPDFNGWDEQKVNDVYITLLYADKVGDFSQVYTSLSMLEMMKTAGVDIDSNIYGVTQETRDVIKAKADEGARSVLESSEVQN